MNTILQQSAADLLARMQAGDLSAVEVTRTFLDRIHRTDGDLQAFLLVDDEGAMAAAERVDERRARGESLGALAGLPVAIKDVLCVRGQRTTCGSRMLAAFRPPYDATLVTKLRQADAILIGKTNMDEFAMGSSNENSAFHPVRNPWDRERVPGGSSGGAAASIAARQVPLSIGTDTGGSIRQPASFCGVVGLKPTYGRVSRYGLVAFASSLDQAGPLARDARDVALLLEAIAGHDPLDSTSAPRPVSPYASQMDEPLKGLRVGVVRSHLAEGVSAAVSSAVEAALDVLRSQGATLLDIDLPHGRYGVAAYYVIAPCEASSNLARYDGIHFGFRTHEPDMLSELAAERRTAGAEFTESALMRLYCRTRTEGFGLEVKRRIMLGTFALSAGYQGRYYQKALQVRRLIRQDYDQAFERVDIVLGPTTPTTAYRLGEKLSDPLSMYMGDLFTVGANLAGLPAISIPCGFDDQGLPIGMQALAPPFEEGRLLRLAHQYQRCTDWHTRRPKLP